MNYRRITCIVILLLCLVLLVGAVSASATITGGTQDYNNVSGTGGLDVEGYTNQTTTANQWITAESLTAVTDGRKVFFTINGQRGAAISYNTTTFLVEGGKVWDYLGNGTTVTNYGNTYIFPSTGSYLSSVTLSNPLKTAGVTLTLATAVSPSGAYINVANPPTVTPLAAIPDSEFTATLNATVSSGSITGYQWYISTDVGRTWSVLGNVGTNPSITFPYSTLGTYLLKCIITASDGNTYDTFENGEYKTVTFSVIPYYPPPTPIIITAASVNPTEGTTSTELTATVTATATGTTITGYQWYSSINSGSTWQPISGAESATSKFTLPVGTYKLKCIVTDGTVNVDSYESGFTDVNVTIYAPPSITSATIDKSAGALDEYVNLSVTATDTAGSTFTYKWKESVDSGSTWSDIGTTKDLRYHIQDTAETTHKFKVEVTGKGGTTTSTQDLTYHSYNKPSITGLSVNPTAGGKASYIDGSLTATGQGTLTYQWKKSTDKSTWTDLEGASGTTPHFTIGNAGTYYIKCIITDEYGQETDSYSAYETFKNVTVTIYEKPSITAFSVNPVEVGINESVSGSITATTTIPSGTLTYTWYSKTSTGEWTEISISGSGSSPTFSFSTAGVYNIKCIVKDQYNQETDTLGSYSDVKVTVFDKPVIESFTIDKSAGALNETVTLTVTANDTTNTISGYEWFEKKDSGDWTSLGTTTTNTKSVPITDTTATLHTFKVKVTGTGGSTESTDNVSYQSYNAPSVTAFSIDKSSVAIGETITGSITASTEIPSGILTYTWYSKTSSGDWTEISISGSGSSPTFSFSTAGVYNIKCIVKDQYNQTTDTIGSYSDVKVTVFDKPVIESFTIDKSAGALNNTVTLTVTANDTTNTISGYEWFEKKDSGDWTSLGTTTTNTKTVNITDTTTTLHTFKVKVTGTGGSTESTDNVSYQSYNAPSVTAFSIDKSSVAIGETITGSITASTEIPSGILTYTWYSKTSSGDWTEISITGAGNNPTFKFGTAGIYNIKCIVKDQYNQETDTIGSYSDVKVTVFDKPVIESFTIDKSAGALNNTVTLTVTANDTTNTISGYEWFEKKDSGDWTSLGTTTTNTKTVNITDTTTTLHTFKVKVTGTGGSTESTDNVSYQSYNAPSVTAFSIDKSSVAIGETITGSITASTEIPSGILTYTWYSKTSSGDWTEISISGSGSSPTFSFSTAGVYNIKCIVKDQYNQTTDTIGSYPSVTVTVYDKPVIESFTIDKTAGALNNTVTLTVTANDTTNTISGYEWFEKKDSGDWTSLGTTTTNTKTVTISDTSKTLHTFKVKVTGTGGSTESTDNVSYQSYNAPSVTAFSIDKSSVAIGETITGSITASTEIPSGTLTYTWYSKTSTGDWTEISISGSGSSPTFSFSTAGVYNIKCIVKDQYNQTTDTIGSYPSVTVTVYDKPVIESFTIDKTAGALNETVTLTVTANDTTNTISGYEWFEKKDSGDWTSLGTTTTDTKTVTISDTSKTLHTFKVKVTGTGGSTESTDNVSYQSYNAPSVTAFSVNPVEVAINGNVTGSITASTEIPSGTLTYTWYSKTSSGDWTEISISGSGYSPTFSFSTAGVYNIKCIVKDQYNQTTDTIGSYPSVTVSVFDKPVINTFTIDKSAGGLNNTVTLTCDATDTTNTISGYEWFEKKDSGDWTSIGTTTTNTKTVTISDTTATLHTFKVKVTGTGGSTESTDNVSYQSYNKPVITDINLNKSVCGVGEAIKGDITASTETPSGDLTYQWYYSLDGGSTWSEIEGARTATPTFSFDEAGTYSVKCIVKDEYNQTTDSVDFKTITVKAFDAPLITSFTISSSAGALNNTVTLHVEANDDVNTIESYKWEESINGGSTWTILGTTTTNEKEVTIADASKTLHDFRVTVTGTGGSTTSTLEQDVHYQSYNAPSITQTTIDPSIGALVSSTTLEVTASTEIPSGTLTYKWEENIGGTWTAIEGKTAKRVQVSVNDSGTTGKTHTYRCIVTDNYGQSSTSEEKTYTTYTLPEFSELTINPTVGAVNESVTVHLHALATGTGTVQYKWQQQIATSASNLNDNAWEDITTTFSTSGDYDWTNTDTSAKTHYIRCVAKDDLGIESPSGEKEYKTYVKPVITSVKAEPNTGSKTATFNLIGEATGFTSVVWQEKNATTGNYEDIAGATSLTSPITLSDTSAKVHTYRLAASVIEGVTAYSSDVTFTSVDLPVITDKGTVSKTEGGLSETVTLEATVSGATSYQWQYSEDGGSTWTNISGAESNPYTGTLTFTTAGDKLLRITATNAAGTVNGDGINYKVYGYPTISAFSVSPVEVGINENVTGSITASGQEITYKWYSKTSTGDWTEISITGAGNNPTFKFGTAGVYNIKSEVTDKFGQKVDTLSSYPDVKVTVFDKPVIESFTIDKTYGALNETVTLTVTANDTTNTISGYEWFEKKDSGDWTSLGTTTTNTKTVTISDTSKTLHTFKVKVTGTGGSTESTDNVSYQSYNAPSVTAFSVNPVEVAINGNVTGSITASTEIPSGTLTYTWYSKTSTGDWTEISISGSGSSPTFSFSTAGVYNIKCIVKDQYNQETDTIGSYSDVKVTVFDKPVIESFTIDKTYGALNDTVTLTVTANDTTNTISGYEWFEKKDSGDWTSIGTTTTNTKTVTISDTSKTLHTFKVKVTGTGGSTESTDNVSYQSYNAPSVTAFSVNPVEVAINGNVSGSITASTEIPSGTLTYTWYSKTSTGDWTEISITGAGNNPTFKFGTAGIYNIKCIVKDQYNQETDTFSSYSDVKVTVFDKPVIESFTIDKTYGALNDTVTLTVTANDTTNTISGYEWFEKKDSGDWTSLGTTTTNTKTVTISDTSKTLHTFKVKVTGTGGSTESTDNVSYQSYNAPSVTAFSIDKSSVAIGETITGSITASTEIPSGTLTYTWYSKTSSGDWTEISISGSGSSPTFSFSTAGVYNIKCIVKDQYNQETDTFSSYSDVKVTVFDKPVIESFTIDKTYGALNDTVTLTVTANDTTNTISGYEWFEKKDSGDWTSLGTTTTNTKTVTISDTSKTLHTFKVKVTGTGGSTESTDNVSYQSYNAPSISAFSVNPVEVAITGNVTGSITASTEIPSGTLTYTWYSKTSTGDWTEISITGAGNNPTFKFGTAGIYNIKCIVKDQYNQETDTIGSYPDVKVTVFDKPVIESFTIDKTSGALNNTVTLTVTANDTTNTISGYEWFEKKDSGSWTSLGTTTTNTKSVSITDTTATLHTFKVKVTGTGGSTESTDNVTYQSINKPSITALSVNPTEQGVSIDVTASVTASGNNITYEWYYSNDAGTNWSQISGVSGSSVQYSFDNAGTYYFKAKVIDDLGQTTDSWDDYPSEFRDKKVVVYDYPTITAISIDKTEGGITTDINGSITASGKDITYKWQSLSNAEGASWQDISGATSATPTFRLTTAGIYKIKCIVTDKYGHSKDSWDEGFRENMTVSIYSNPVIESFTIDKTAGALSNTVTLTATASDSTNTITGYEWFEKKDSGDWTSLGTTTTNTKTVIINDSSKTLHTFKVKVTGTGGSTESTDNVSYQSYNKPSVTAFSASPVNVVINENVTGSITASTETPSGNLTYVWYSSKDSGSTWQEISITGTGSNPTFKFGTSGDYLLKVRVTDEYNQTTDTYDISEFRSVIIHVHDLMEITAVTVDKTEGGLSTVFKADVTHSTGATPYTYKWYSSNNSGSTWSELSTEKSPDIQMSAAGTYYLKVVVKDNAGQEKDSWNDYDTFRNVKFTVSDKPVISNVSVTPTEGSTSTTFKLQVITASGHEPMTFKYAYSTDGTTWTDLTSFISEKSYEFSGLPVGTYKLKVIAKDSYGQETDSYSAYETFKNITITIKAAPVIESVYMSVHQGGLHSDNVTFRVTPHTEGNKYTWQYSTDKANWTNYVEDTTLSEFTDSIYLSAAGTYYFRVIAKNVGGETPCPESMYQEYVAYGTPTVTNPTVTPATGVLDKWITLSATTTGSSARTYQWYDITSGSPVAIPTAISETSTIHIQDSTPTVHTYVLTVTDFGDFATSDPVTYTSISTPVITNPKINGKETEKGSTTATFTLSASATGYTEVNWQENTGGDTWVDIAGANTLSYTMPSTTLSVGMHSYRLRATNIAGNTYSVPTLTYIAYGLPTISNVTITPNIGGADATFTVMCTASGADNLSYQWEEYNGTSWVALTGKTNYQESIQIHDGSSPKNHDYRCVVTDYGGTSYSSTVTFIAIAPPTGGISSISPSSGSTTPTVTLTGNSTGRATLTYQWYMQSGVGSTPQPITGANTKVWTGTITVPEGTTTFFLRTTNLAGSSDSDPCTYTTVPAPTVTIRADPIAVATGGSSTLTATGTDIVSYQWYESTNSGISWNPLGTTNPYTVTNLAAGTHMFKCVVTGSTGLSTTSNIESVFSGGVPIVEIVSPATGTTYNAGDRVEFAGQVSGDTETFLWDFGGDVNILEGDGTLQPTVRYLQGGHKTVKLTATNRYGSQTYTIEITVASSIRPAAVSNVAKVDSTMGGGMMNFINTVTTPDQQTQMPNIMGIITGILNPFTNIIGAWVFLFLFAVPYVIMWIRQKNTMIPSIIGIIFAVFMIVKFPAGAIAPACIILALSISGGIYGIYVKKSNQ